MQTTMLTIYDLLFTIYRLWWWAKVAIGNEAGTCRVILLRQRVRPTRRLFAFFRSLDHVIVFFASRRDRYLALQISAE